MSRKREEKCVYVSDTCLDEILDAMWESGETSFTSDGSNIVFYQSDGLRILLTVRPTPDKLNETNLPTEA